MGVGSWEHGRRWRFDDKAKAVFRVLIWTTAVAKYTHEMDYSNELHEFDQRISYNVRVACSIFVQVMLWFYRVFPSLSSFCSTEQITLGVGQKVMGNYWSA